MASRRAVCGIAVLLLLIAAGVATFFVIDATRTQTPSPSAPPPLPTAPPIPLSVQLVAVGERSAAGLHPEPYKPTHFVLSQAGTSRRLSEGSACVVVTWRLLVPSDEQPGGRNTSTHRLPHCSTTFAVTFGAPGSYQLAVLDAQNEQTVHANVTLRNVYVRRELRALTPSEWAAYVHAVWTLRNTSTAVGRSTLHCPRGTQDDYKEYDFFVLFHALYSANATCDQLHFSMMQEFAHEAWNTLFERALQCVNPSVALHYWNETLDRTTYGTTRDGLLSSPVWNATYYGQVWNATPADACAGYVSDGAFAYFPLAQTRTGLCHLMPAGDQARCEAFIHNSLWWTGPANETGFSLRSPRDQYAYVSRRTGHLFGQEDTITPLTFPRQEAISEYVLGRPLVDGLKYITGDAVHGHAHYWLSGMWDPECDGQGTTPAAVAALNTSDVEALRLYVWPQDARARVDGCITCNATQCTCAPDSAARGCWDSNASTPDDSFDARDGTYSSASWWHTWLHDGRKQNTPYRRSVYGCGMLRGGTFDRSATANADPTFYLHHAFTFKVVDLAKRAAPDPAPFYGLDNASRYECAGHGLNDTTVFSDLVPYTHAQAAGSRHTWRDILTMWTVERNTAEWE